ncbi:NUDIX domain-containing protein [Microlunatus capsulatus]|uniref:8-oxo-dGTP pyrophosphatase MutT (NUDIX family) n=1 Tax=Microlunatus capsulatus TaxID=99117 RepID=A0ABS4Z3I5_9ACTN|nr:NUDIX hydrolase [Microlunatus capsulatus]MBP2415600.1 8-oxo-dGTP pyrophosphatase MutT (NUDIX family) [Microlunatus capsulatus]
MPDLGLTVAVDGDTAVLAWSGVAGEAEAAGLVESVSAAAAAALGGPGVRRLQAAVAAEDGWGRRALLLAGFRLEGVRRQARPDGEGGHQDEWLFARLAGDVVSGPDGFSAVMSSALPRKRLIAHVLLRDVEGRVMLCETRFKADWELPGGIVEAGEPPRLGALRELREELGVEWPVGRLLVADWMPPYLGWEDALELVYDGGLVSEDDLDRFVLQPSEIIQARLCTLEEAAALVTPLSHRRLTLAAGLGPGETAYLEDGLPPR